MEKKSVRYGVVGLGGMGLGHLKSLVNIEEAEITAVCDIDAETLDERCEAYGVPGFSTHKELMDSGLVDAVTIATPHYFHSPVAVDAMERGLHVMCEKPLSVSVADADLMVDAAHKSGVSFAIMYQRRTEAMMEAAKKIIDEGVLGKLYRRTILDPSFRTQAYYDSATWRGTWKGEGGGVLLNQAPHGIDLFIWMGGLPSRITAITRTWRHDISVEDEASALLEYSDGGIGYYFTSTNEAPGGFYMELSGESGKMRIDSYGIKLWSLEKTMQEFSDDASDMWGKPVITEKEVEIIPRETGHIAILRNLTANILTGEPLIAPGVDGLAAVEFINGVILSGDTGKPVDIPLDRMIYEGFLTEKRRLEKPKKAVTKAVRKTDPKL